MSAACRIIEAGFYLETDGERLVVKPASKLTEELRAFIRAHKLEIIRELRAVNEGAPAGTPGDVRPPGPSHQPAAGAGPARHARGRAGGGGACSRAGTAGRDPEESIAPRAGCGRTPWSREVLAEAREERAAILEHDSGMSRAEADQVAELFADFMNHLMGPGVRNNCCHAPAGRYCIEGARLQMIYYLACEEKRGFN